MVEYGCFCELYGRTLRNKVLEYMLEMFGLDFAIGDIAKEISISRPKAYQIFSDLEKKEFVKKTRIVSGTQLYALDKNNKEVKLLHKSFLACLKLVASEHTKINSHILESKNKAGKQQTL